MASPYMGEDELDYEDENYAETCSPHVEQEDMDEEVDDYNDLYRDIDVGFFSNSAEAVKNELEKPSRGFGVPDELATMKAAVEQRNGNMETAAEAQLQVATSQNQYRESQEDTLVAAEPRIDKDETVREIMGEDERQAKAHDLNYGKLTIREAVSTSFTATQDETCTKATDGTGQRNAVVHSTDRLMGVFLTTDQDKEHSVVPQVRSEISAPLQIISTSSKDKVATSGEEVHVESRSFVTLEPGTNRPVSNLECGATVLSAGGGVPGEGAEEGVRGERMISPWDGGGSGPTGATFNSAATAGATPGVNKASTASTTHYYSGRGSSQFGDGGSTRLLVRELHWWTTDAELEGALSEYGRVKTLKFFEERASGKSKGGCQVEFYDSSAARACKQGMDGRKFNGRPCVVTFSSPYTLRQMSAAHIGKTQASQTFIQGRKTTADVGGIKSGSSTAQGGKVGTSARSQAGLGRTGQGHSFRGRGVSGTRSMGAGGGGGGGGGGVPAYVQGNLATLAGPAIPPQGMMGQGYDPTYGIPMGRSGLGYGGYVPRPAYAGFGISYPTVGPGGLPGVAPHVNPVFFGRGGSMNGMGLVAGNSMEGAGGWAEASVSGWGGEEHDQRVRESSYDEESGGVDYPYGIEMTHERGRLGLARDKGRDGEWGPYGERRHRGDRDVNWEREKHRERGKDRNWGDAEYERQRHARTKHKPKATDDDEQRARLRDEDYGKRRQMLR